MDEEKETEDKDAEFAVKKAEQEKKDAEKTEKNRLKREKARQRKEKGKLGPAGAVKDGDEGKKEGKKEEKKFKANVAVKRDGVEEETGPVVEEQGIVFLDED
jgi:hypothetical protein